MRLLPFIIFALLSIVFLYGLSTSNAPDPINKVTSSTVRPAPKLHLTKFQDVQPPKLSELGNKPILINFFASWCVPCLAEHPLMLKLAEGQDITLYGIAWKDTPEAIANWLDKHGNPYNHLAIDDSSRTAISYGLTGVPESFLIKNGNIVFHHAGPLTKDIISQNILLLLEDK